MITDRSRAMLSAFALLIATHSRPARAQDFPTRPITIVLPYPPGASTEQVARLVQPIMQERLKQPVVIENKPGGNGSIGTLAGRARRAGRLHDPAHHECADDDRAERPERAVRSDQGFRAADDRHPRHSRHCRQSQWCRQRTSPSSSPM